MRDDTRPHHRYGHRGQPHDPRQREPAQQHECSPKWVPTHISARSYALRAVRPATPLTSCSPSSPSALPLHGAVGVRDFSQGASCCGHRVWCCSALDGRGAGCYRHWCLPQWLRRSHTTVDMKKQLRCSCDRTHNFFHRHKLSPTSYFFLTLIKIRI